MRPLSQDLINYAIDEVSHLLSLADKLNAELGQSQLKLIARLSLNYSQWYWQPADRGKSKGACKPSEVATLTPFSPGSWLGKLCPYQQGEHCSLTKWSDDKSMFEVAATEVLYVAAMLFCEHHFYYLGPVQLDLLPGTQLICMHG